MFSIPHILFMVFTVISICIINKKTVNKDMTKLLKFIAIIMVFFDPVFWLYSIYVSKHINYSTIHSLYICSLFWMLFPFAMFIRNNNSTFKRIALSMCATVVILSGSMGILFNTYVAQGMINFPTIRSLLYHYLMMLAMSLLWSQKIYVPEKRDKYLSFIPVVVLVVVCYVVNIFTGWDYCYTAGGMGTPFNILFNIVNFIVPIPVVSKIVYLIIVYTTYYFLNTSIINFAMKKNGKNQ